MNNKTPFEQLIEINASQIARDMCPQTSDRPSWRIFLRTVAWIGIVWLVWGIIVLALLGYHPVCV